MDQVFLASDLECAAEQAARIEAGHYEAGQRVLLISNNAPIPELTPGFDESEEFSAIAAHFDRVARLNPIIEPHHPLVWRPADQAAWETVFREALGLSGAFGLTLSAPAELPDAVLVELFPDAPVESVLAPAGQSRAAGPVAAALGRVSGLAQRVRGRLGRGLYWLRTLTFRPS